MIKSSFTGKTKIKRFEGQYGPNYYCNITKKNMDGKWENASMPIKFKKGVDVPDGVEIDIKTSWLTFNKGKTDSKKIYWQIFCTEFVSCSEDEPFVPDTDMPLTSTEFEELVDGDNGLPF